MFPENVYPSVMVKISQKGGMLLVVQCNVTHQPYPREYGSLDTVSLGRIKNPCLPGNHAGHF